MESKIEIQDYDSAEDRATLQQEEAAEYADMRAETEARLKQDLQKIFSKAQAIDPRVRMIEEGELIISAGKKTTIQEGTELTDARQRLMSIMRETGWQEIPKHFMPRESLN